MTANVDSGENVPRMVMAAAATIAAIFAPGALLKTAFCATAVGLVATVASRYCPVNDIIGREIATEPAWRTIRTWRVEA